MTLVRLLLIDTDGISKEHENSDEIVFGSFQVSGGGPLMSASGLNMFNTDVVGVQNLNFNDPTTGTVNLTSGPAVIDAFMVNDRDNFMGASGAILFPTVPNAGPGLDAFRFPTVSGIPTAPPSQGGSGYSVYDYLNNDLYVWDGDSWNSQSIVESANNIDNTYTAGVGITSGQWVYISSANTVSLTDADNATQSQTIGVAVNSALIATPVIVRSEGIMGGYTGLTPGARYFLDFTTAGGVITATPTGTLRNIVQVGYAKSTTELHIQIDFLARRGA